MFFLRDPLPNPGEWAYRYEDRSRGVARYDYCGEFEGFAYHYPEIVVTEWRVLGFTPKGFWIECGYGPNPRRWIGHAWRKKFAHLNHAEAQFSFKKRKEAQLRKLRTQLGHVERVHAAISAGHWEGKCPALFSKVEFNV
jgi:hypothetical protein